MSDSDAIQSRLENYASSAVKQGSVIQISESHPIFSLHGTLMIVEEVKSWGVQGYVQIPYKGTAFFRVSNGSYYLVGEAVLALADTEDTEDEDDDTEDLLDNLS